ncbi:hypothetical protein Ahy_B08g089682 [Arachis hypogaea]|uniref:Uncharacterized protein n=1 Tax=Arachis hypogaea TaxID=3818 RepID=A0A444XYK2_ARAHY|nr:hypothetical protein Ahy_B08g089682 [Arachis hypogaea]
MMFSSRAGARTPSMLGTMLAEAVLNSDICFKEIEEIPCMFCPHKPKGSIPMIVKLNLLLLEDISDDIDFCFKLAKEESVIILPGKVLQTKITFLSRNNGWTKRLASHYFHRHPSALVEGLKKVKVFCQRHARKWPKQC